MTNPRFVHHTNFELKLTFDPLIESLETVPDYFVFQHWQARPKGLRHYGYFSYVKGEHHYQTIPWNRCIIDACPIPLQVDERVIKTVPTAVLFYPDSQLIKDGAVWTIKKIPGLTTKGISRNAI